MTSKKALHFASRFLNDLLSVLEGNNNDLLGNWKEVNCHASTYSLKNYGLL
jgi:hypothetical protein